jgi:hypothetical protein
MERHGMEKLLIVCLVWELEQGESRQRQCCDDERFPEGSKLTGELFVFPVLYGLDGNDG